MFSILYTCIHIFSILRTITDISTLLLYVYEYLRKSIYTYTRILYFMCVFISSLYYIPFQTYRLYFFMCMNIFASLSIHALVFYILCVCSYLLCTTYHFRYIDFTSLCVSISSLIYLYMHSYFLYSIRVFRSPPLHEP